MKMMLTSPLFCDHVILRPLAEGDLPFTLALRNQYRRFFIKKDEISADEHAQWFRRYIVKDDDFTFVIVERATGAPAGQAAVYSIDPVERTAEFGRLMVDPAFTGRGYAREATETLLGFARSRGVRWVVLTVYAWNTNALRIYRRLGFGTTSQEGDLLTMSKELA